MSYKDKKKWSVTDYNDWIADGELPNTTVLELAMTDNKNITNLSDNIGNLRNLKRLVLTDTSISQLPSSIGRLKFLEVLGLDDTNIVTLPTEIRSIVTYDRNRIEKPIYISVDNTPLSRNPPNIVYDLPRRFRVTPLISRWNPSKQQLIAMGTVEETISPEELANDIITMEEKPISEFLNEGFKIFMYNTKYFALKKEFIEPQINDKKKQYYLCKGNNPTIITNNNPLISTILITPFQGFVFKDQLTTAFASANNYFKLMEKNKNIKVKKGLLLGNDCISITDSLYEIKVLNVTAGMEQQSSSSSTNSEIYGDNSRGGRSRKRRKSRNSKKSKKSKKSRKNRKH
jgi:Leucine-rich repeat (LRR) protein